MLGLNKRIICLDYSKLEARILAYINTPKENKMKQLVIEQPITDLYNVDAVKKLDERPETCDWVAAYVTSSGLIARLCSYNQNRGCGWVAGFKYINPSSQHQKNECYFEQRTHIASIKTAINAERKVMLFNNEAEFYAWYKKQEHNYSC